jgi:hypothetical protein
VWNLFGELKAFQTSARILLISFATAFLDLPHSHSVVGLHVFFISFDVLWPSDSLLSTFSGAAKLLHFPFFMGTPVVIMPRFDPVAFCAHIEKYKVTAALTVPPMVLTLTRHPG